MSENPKQPAWRKRLYQPQPPNLNLSDISPEEADAREETRRVAHTASTEKKSDNEEG